VGYPLLSDHQNNMLLNLPGDRNHWVLDSEVIQSKMVSVQFRPVFLTTCTMLGPTIRHKFTNKKYSV